MKIFAINPGSTSTKVALIEDEKTLFSKTVAHEAAKLDEFATISDQMPYRLETIQAALDEAGYTLDGVDAFVGRGGGLISCDGGVYEVTDLVLDHAQRGANGTQHPAQLGPQIAHQFAEQYGKPAYVVNPPDTDELQDLARMTGVKGLYRIIHLHALNLKETATRHAASLGKKYSECNFVVCHIGGGISISAHRAGKMIDGYDIVGGEGPMAPTRAGSLSLGNVVEYLKDHTVDDLKKLSTKTGGFVNHCGISDAIELRKRAADGDKEAAMVWDTMIYQIEKCIGAMSTALEGKVDAILLGGGMVHDDDLVAHITKTCSWIAPVVAYPGEFEMEAMAAGAIRVMTGQEELKVYTGKKIWDGFEWDKQ